MGNIDTKRGKMNKTAFLYKVAKRNNMDYETVTAVYNAIVNEMQRIICSGKDLSLTGFGTFYLQKHKGHRVQFEDKNKTIDDYYVFKFSASDVFNNKIRNRMTD